MIDTYADGLKGARGFTARVYKGHRQVVGETSGKDTCISNHEKSLDLPFWVYALVLTSPR